MPCLDPTIIVVIGDLRGGGRQDPADTRQEVATRKYRGTHRWAYKRLHLAVVDG